MKRGTRIVLATILLVAVALCTGLSDLASAAQEKTFTMWIHSNPAYVEFHQAAIKDFEKKTGIKIKLEIFPHAELKQKVTAAFAAGKEPDLLEVPGTWMRLYADMGRLSNPSRWGFGKKVMENYWPSSVACLTRKGSPWGVPANINIDAGPAIIIDVKAFQEAGVSTNGWPDWSSFVADLKKLTKRDAKGNIIRSGIEWLNGTHPSTFDMFVYQAGGQMYNKDGTAAFNSEAGRKALRIIDAFINDYKVDTVETGDFMSVGKGIAASILNGPWVTALLDKDYPNVEWKFVRMPTIDGAKAPYWGIFDAWGWFVPERIQSKNKGFAWEYIKYLADPENHLKWSLTTGEFPSNIALSKRSEVANSPRWSVWVPLIQYQRFSDHGIGAEEYRRILTDEIVKPVWYGRMTVEEALKAGAAKVNNLKAQFKEIPNK